jgi:hypothetical protein
MKSSSTFLLCTFLVIRYVMVIAVILFHLCKERIIQLIFFVR